MIPLLELQSGQQGTIRALRGGHCLKARLATLGFTPGAPVKMVRRGRHGPVIVSVRGTQIALGRGEAQRILILMEEHNDALFTNN